MQQQSRNHALEHRQDSKHRMKLAELKLEGIHSRRCLHLVPNKTVETSYRFSHSIRAHLCGVAGLAPEY